MMNKIFIEISKGHFIWGSKVQQNGAFLLVESHKLDPRPLNEDPRPIETKLRWHLHGTILEGNSISPDQEMELKEEFMVWRTKM
jgi:hypothetical protein